MKRLIGILVVMNAFGICAQTWTSVDASNYHASHSFFFSNSNFFYSAKQFGVNPYDNSIWFSRGNEVLGFDPFGNYFFYDQNNSPFLQNASRVQDFGFTSTYSFILDRTYGLYKSDGINWTSVTGLTNGVDISYELDTIRVARDINNYFTWEDGSVVLGSFATSRIESKNGFFWLSGGNVDVTAMCDEGIITYFSPDTCNLLDWSNFDFKFSDLTDSMFVAGEKGISIAYDGVFVDSITPNNTINMPSPSVWEIEFDSQDNIWAVFGDWYTNVTHIGYLDRATDTWTMVYDESNSPIDFSYRVTIELDANDNLYVCDHDLHVLDLNGIPAWLGTASNTISPFTVFPNPSNGEFTIDLPKQLNATHIEILDVSGRVVTSTKFALHQTLNVKSGTYFLSIFDGDELLGTQKISVK